MKSGKNAVKMDILNGSIWNKLPLYALPVAATGILEQLLLALALSGILNVILKKALEYRV